MSIDTKLNVDVGGMHRAIKIKNKAVINEIVNNVILIAKREAPVHFGTFAESIKRLDERGAEDNGASTERFIRIGPSVYYSKYVVNATRPSPGAYVPQLDVRIRGGVHPGTKANPVMARTKRRVKPIIKKILQTHYGNVELGRFIR